MQTKNYWRNVKTVWQQLIAQNQAIEINKTTDGQWMFMPFFQRASELKENQQDDPQKEQQWILDMLQKFIRLCDNQKGKVTCYSEP